MRRSIFLGATSVALLAFISLWIGVSDVSPATLFGPSEDGRALQVLLISRVPRTLALVLAGTSMAVAGTVMQLLARNRFVDASTAGTIESATFGLLIITVLAPNTPPAGKMLFAAFTALLGTLLFLWVLRQIPLRSVLVVPLVGMMLGGVISAVTTFFAYRLELIQSLSAWMTGSFASVLRGRYELLWIGLGLTVLAYVMADRFTVAGMGRDFMTNLGLSYRQAMLAGLTIVSMVTAVVVVTVGMMPFIGLVIPNLARQFMGDNLRLSLPWIALGGAGLVLVCDILGRVVNAPYEIPIGVVIGVVGSLIFLSMLLRREARLA